MNVERYYKITEKSGSGKIIAIIKTSDNKLEIISKTGEEITIGKLGIFLSENNYLQLKNTNYDFREVDKKISKNSYKHLKDDQI